MEWMAYLLSNWTLLEVLEYLSSFDRGDFLFCGVGRPAEAETLSGVASDQHGAGQRREWGTDRCVAGVERRRSAARGSGFVDGVSARDPAEEGEPVAGEFCRSGCEGRGDARSEPGKREPAISKFSGREDAGASLRWSVLDDADFTGAQLRDTDLTGASLENTDLRSANLEGAKWGKLRSVKGTNVYGVKKALAGFVEWALGGGTGEGRIVAGGQRPATSARRGR
jgi:Pentapeptide repeats (8 copies)